MQMNIVCHIYSSPDSNFQELLEIKIQILKMTVTPQKRWTQRRKQQKKNSCILVAIAVCLFSLTSITIKATVTGTSASCRGGFKKLATRMDLYLELACYLDKRTIQRTPSQIRQNTRSTFSLSVIYLILIPGYEHNTH